MTTVRESEIGTPTVMPLVAILGEEGQMTGITCPLNLGVDPHDIEGCEDLLESYFMQVRQCFSHILAAAADPALNFLQNAVTWKEPQALTISKTDVQHLPPPEL